MKYPGLWATALATMTSAACPTSTEQLIIEDSGEGAPDAFEIVQVAQVRALEEALGEKLFSRVGRNLVLTDLERIVLRYGR